MKVSIASLVGLFVVALFASPVLAATLTWDRNSEIDMKDYAVYACFTANCIVTKTPTMLQPGFTLQPTVGVLPTHTLDIVGKEGSVAVTARDQVLNESSLSVQVPFDAKAPVSPGSPRFQ